MMNVSDQESVFPNLNEDGLNSLLSEVAHKMKNKLGGIHGFASLLEKDLPSNDSRRRLVHKVQDGILQLNETISQFMKLVQNVELQPVKIEIRDIPPVIRDALGDLSTATASGIQVILDGEGSPSIYAFTDPVLLRETVVHTIHFLLSVADRIEEIHVNAPDSETVQILFLYRPGKNDPRQNQPEAYADLIRNTVPIDARLHLAAACKLTQCLGGTTTIRHESSLRKWFVISLNRGITQ